MPNETAFLHIEKPGTRCTLQDLGRPSYMHMGVSPAGSADQHAALWANRLLNNPANASVLEISFGGFVGVFESTTQIAICGSDVDIWVNDQRYRSWRSISISAGSRVRIGMPKSGVYCYLALRHGFLENNVLGSQSITVREMIGPNDAEAFQTGDTLTYKGETSNPPIRYAHWNSIPNYKEKLILNLYVCQQGESLSHIQTQQLLSNTYAVTPDSNKMGVRLDGLPVELNTTVKTSEGVIAGIVQLPPSGLPIILLAEHQTIGGYPKIGTISRVDTYKLAQRRPGQTVQFRLIDFYRMQKTLNKFRQFFL